MCENHFEFKTTCSYCLRKMGEDIDIVIPVYDWENNELLGYFCKEHYIKVKSRNISENEKIG